MKIIYQNRSLHRVLSSERFRVRLLLSVSLPIPLRSFDVFIIFDSKLVFNHP